MNGEKNCKYCGYALKRTIPSNDPPSTTCYGCGLFGEDAKKMVEEHEPPVTDNPMECIHCLAYWYTLTDGSQEETDYNGECGEAHSQVCPFI